MRENMSVKNCTDYWLDRESLSFVGDFEGMYRDIADPWGCAAESDGLNNRLFLELLFGSDRYGAILDIGCGLGGFSNQLHRRNDGGQVFGVDISETAVAKARESYPSIQFRAFSVLSEPIEGAYDLITLSEVLWYVLDGLEDVFSKIDAAMSENGKLGIKQYFPYTQRFGADKLKGIEGFEAFLERSTRFRMTSKLVNHQPPDGVVLLAILER